MLPSNSVLEQARQARDPRFDGRFFIGVRTTGIYCRPVCPVKMPKAENVTFFNSAAAAAEAGYRPCLRCRPETSPGTPAWMGTSTTVNRALRLINEGALDDSGVQALSDRLGVTSRHLNRLFVKHVGASPKTIAQTRKLHFAKKLIDETRLPMADIAMSAGYGSVRRFNDHVRQTYGKAPNQLRKEVNAVAGEALTLKVGFREPYNFSRLLDFFRLRATPGVESICEDSYQRRFSLDDEPGMLTVTRKDSHLHCLIEGGSTRSLMKVIAGVRRMFDTDAIPEEVNRVLESDPELGALVCQHPGLRLPGAFDPFEVAVRAIVGQQVSVKGATTVMGKLADLHRSADQEGGFPSAARLAQLDPEALPMPTKRAVAIKTLAKAVSDGELRFDVPDETTFYEQLVAMPGIGPWTADYIAMRARGNPDAFLHGDLVIRKASEQLFGLSKPQALLERAEQWRPWRGYAGMHIWRYAAEDMRK